MPFARGRLAPASAAPDDGEHVRPLAQLGQVVIDQILSGRLEAPVDYLQDVDEWVTVVHGAAVLEVDGQRMELSAGDWVLLPTGTPHRLVETQPGTSWLTVTSQPTDPPTDETGSGPLSS
jgi:mannose-6-phosphate isomerase-like protein (cupin superfamily)